MKIDHVTIAGSSLNQLAEAFDSLGLTTDYGGAHSNGITHMALLGFEDGSYIELISSIEPGSRQDHAFWGNHIEGDGGPCAWAIDVEDVDTEATRVAGLGISVIGPHYSNRRRPDGALVEWNSAFLGNKGAGATLPFIIKDITPRELRVRPSVSLAGQAGEPPLLTGIDTVVLSAADLGATMALLRRVYDWPTPQIKDDPIFGATLADFTGTPATLATPLSGQAWLTERLTRFDESPCAYLIGTSDFEAAYKQFDVTEPVEWFGRQAVWFNPDKLDGIRLGIVG
jgi:hypothetical protein